MMANVGRCHPLCSVAGNHFLPGVAPGSRGRHHQRRQFSMRWATTNRKICALPDPSNSGCHVQPGRAQLEVGCLPVDASTVMPATSVTFIKSKPSMSSGSPLHPQHRWTLAGLSRTFPSPVSCRPATACQNNAFFRPLSNTAITITTTPCPLAQHSINE